MWDAVGPDFVAEILPLQFESEISWHYELEPIPESETVQRAELLDRAQDLRRHAASDPEP